MWDTHLNPPSREDLQDERDISPLGLSRQSFSREETLGLAEEEGCPKGAKN